MRISRACCCTSCAIVLVEPSASASPAPDLDWSVCMCARVHVHSRACVFMYYVSDGEKEGPGIQFIEWDDVTPSRRAPKHISNLYSYHFLRLLLIVKRVFVPIWSAGRKV